jgi:hypothetical protein
VPRLILVVAVLAVLYLLLRRVKSTPPHLRRAEYIKIALIIILAVTLLLAATGRMHWIGAAFTALLVAARQSLPLLLRLFPLLAGLRASKPASTGQTSTVETTLLRMHLDHDSGALQGEVLKGAFQGWRLADMDRRQLEQFMAYCKREDNDSLQLLDSYWQQRFPGEAFAGGHAGTPSGEAHAMERADALAVLGLPESATKEQIIEAHRKLIQKVHPDRGGNDYLAGQINRARDILLG